MLKSSRARPKTNKPKKQKGVAAPLARCTQARTAKPAIRQSATGIRVKHSELVTTVGGAGAFSVTTFPLNPGQSETFPWLSTLASSWEAYRVHRLAFRYVTRCSATDRGSILVAPDYDPADGAPSSEQRMSTYQNCVESSLWRDFTVTLDPRSMMGGLQRKFVRVGAITAVEKRTSDLGNLFVGVVGSSDTFSVGKLWVDYDVEFMTPQTRVDAHSEMATFQVTGTTTDQNVILPNASTTTLIEGNVSLQHQASTVIATNMFVGRHVLVCVDQATNIEGAYSEFLGPELSIVGAVAVAQPVVDIVRTGGTGAFTARTYQITNETIVITVPPLQDLNSDASAWITKVTLAMIPQDAVV